MQTIQKFTAEQTKAARVAIAAEMRERIKARDLEREAARMAKRNSRDGV